jgi:hypothetical protein
MRETVGRVKLRSGGAIAGRPALAPNRLSRVGWSVILPSSGLLVSRVVSLAVTGNMPLDTGSEPTTVCCGTAVSPPGCLTLA